MCSLFISLIKVLSYFHFFQSCFPWLKRKSSSDSVLWHKSLYQQKIRQPMDNKKNNTQNVDNNDFGPTKDGQFE